MLMRLRLMLPFSPLAPLIRLRLLLLRCQMPQLFCHAIAFTTLRHYDFRLYAHFLSARDYATPLLMLSFSYALRQPDISPPCHCRFSLRCRCCYYAAADAAAGFHCRFIEISLLRHGDAAAALLPCHATLRQATFAFRDASLFTH